MGSGDEKIKGTVGVSVLAKGRESRQAGYDCARKAAATRKVAASMKGRADNLSQLADESLRWDHHDKYKFQVDMGIDVGVIG